MIDFDVIQKQRSFRTVTMSADMPGSAADLVEGLLARFQADPDKLAIVQEMILVEGAKVVLAQLGGEDKPAQKRGRKPKAIKPDVGTAPSVTTASPFGTAAPSAAE